MSARERKSIKFSCMSADDVRRMSVMQVKTRAQLSDARMGSVGRCETCGLFGSECPGHYGHIELPVAVPHPIHLAKLKSIASTHCGSCGAVMGRGKCAACNGAPLSAEKSRMWLNPVWDIIGRKLFIQCLPVPPMRMRFPNNDHDAPITSLLVRVLLACDRHARTADEFRAFTAVNAAVHDYMMSPSDSGAQGLVSRLKGKEGRLRQNLMGWRVNMAGRAVASPNPDLAPWEVAVPRKIADVLHMKDGDTCLVNRQPSLHRSSMMAHVVRVTDAMTVGISPTVTPPYNADFDGDELNLHHVSRNNAIECRMLMGVENNMICPGTNTVSIRGVQDTVLARFLATGQDAKTTSQQLCDVMIKHGQNAGARFVQNEQRAGVEFLSGRGFSAGLDDFNVHVPCPVQGKMAVAEACKTILDKVPRQNRISQMIRAGSKGKLTNLVQLFCCIGHQTVQGKPSVAPPYDEQSSSFVSSSYVKGMTPTEFWHHATAAREGMIETAIKTAKCGYTMRKMIKCLENMVVQADGTLRSISTGSVVQFKSGEDGVNPAKVILRSGKEEHCAGNHLAEHGDAMGILAAQSIGERLTQLTLDTFHSTGLAHDYGLARVQNILGGYKSAGERCMGIPEPYVHARFAVFDVCKSVTKHCRRVSDAEENQSWLVGRPVRGVLPACVLELDADKMQHMCMSAWKIASNIMHTHRHCTATYSSTHVYVYGLDVHENFETGSPWATTGAGVAGNGVSADTLPHLGLQCYSSNARRTAELLGVEAARACIVEDLRSCMGNVNIRHIYLLADAITHFGKIVPMTRSYVAKSDSTAVLGMASFETVANTIAIAARGDKIDPILSVSSAISMGQMPCMGTNCFDILEKCNGPPVPRQEVSDIVALLSKPASRKRSFSQLIGGI